MKTIILHLVCLCIFFIEAEAQLFGKIIFERLETAGTQKWHLFSMNRDGSNQQAITSGNSANRSSHISIDGRKIIWQRSELTSPPYFFDIYIMNSNGTGMQNLTAVPALTQSCMMPRFSRDGKKISFIYQASANNGDIWIMNSDGTSHQPVLSDSYNDMWPQITPDGKWIVFQRQTAPDPNPKSKICKIRLSDNFIADLTDGSDLDEMPFVSPDGQNVIFKRGFGELEIYRMPIDHNPADTLQLVNLTKRPGQIDDAPQYSVEGDKIAWMSGSGNISNFEIWIMNSDGSNQLRLTNNTVADFDPTFSPLAEILSSPVLFYPPDSASGNFHIVNFKWFKVTGAINYRMQVSKDSLFSVLHTDSLIANDTTLLLQNIIDLVPHYWRVKSIGAAGESEWSQTRCFFNVITDVPLVSVIKEFSLSQNYPNPFNPTTIINYELPTSGLRYIPVGEFPASAESIEPPEHSATEVVTLKIYDMLGREIETLVNKEQPAGRYSVEWNASKYSSGIYYYELRAGEFRNVKKMVLVK